MTVEAYFDNARRNETSATMKCRNASLDKLRFPILRDGFGECALKVHQPDQLIRNCSVQIPFPFIRRAQSTAFVAPKAHFYDRIRAAHTCPRTVANRQRPLAILPHSADGPPRMPLCPFQWLSGQTF